MTETQQHLQGQINEIQRIFQEWTMYAQGSVTRLDARLDEVEAKQAETMSRLPVLEPHGNAINQLESQMRQLRVDFESRPMDVQVQQPQPTPVPPEGEFSTAWKEEVEGKLNYLNGLMEQMRGELQETWDILNKPPSEVSEDQENHPTEDDVQSQHVPLQAEHRLMEDPPRVKVEPQSGGNNEPGNNLASSSTCCLQSPPPLPRSMSKAPAEAVLPSRVQEVGWEAQDTVEAETQPQMSVQKLDSPRARARHITENFHLLKINHCLMPSCKLPS